MGKYLDKAGLEVALKTVKEYVDNAGGSSSLQSMTCSKIWEGTSRGDTNSIANGTFASKDFDYIFMLLFARDTDKIENAPYSISNNAGMLIGHSFAAVKTGTSSVAVSYNTTDNGTTTAHVLLVLNRSYNNGESNEITVQNTNFPSSIYYKCEVYGIKATIR